MIQIPLLIIVKKNSMKKTKKVDEEIVLKEKLYKLYR